MVRILHLADVHLDAPFAWAEPEVARRCRSAIREALRTAVRTAAEGGYDAVTIAGDLYEHDWFTADTGAFLRALFGEVHPLPVLIAPGNHDWFGPESLYRQVKWSPNVRVFRERRFERVEILDGMSVWGAAHLAPAHTPNLLDGTRVDGGGTHLALFHGSEQGGFVFQEEGKVPHAPFKERDVAEAGFHFALVGHHHRPRVGDVHAYPGNPCPLSFGEGHVHGALAVSVTDDDVLVEPVALGAEPWHDVVVDVSGATSSTEVRDRVAAALAGLRGIARVTVVGQLAPAVELTPADLRGIEHELDAYVPRIGRISFDYDIEALRAEPTVRGQFVRDVLDAPDLDEVQRRRVLLTGLRALDGRSDLEVV